MQYVSLSLFCFSNYTYYFLLPFVTGVEHQVKVKAVDLRLVLQLQVLRLQLLLLPLPLLSLVQLLFLQLADLYSVSSSNKCLPLLCSSSKLLPLLCRSSKLLLLLSCLNSSKLLLLPYHSSKLLPLPCRSSKLLLLLLCRSSKLLLLPCRSSKLLPLPCHSSKLLPWPSYLNSSKCSKLRWFLILDLSTMGLHKYVLYSPPCISVSKANHSRLNLLFRREVQMLSRESLDGEWLEQDATGHVLLLKLSRSMSTIVPRR
jgi:hypothetical protein